MGIYNFLRFFLIFTLAIFFAPRSVLAIAMAGDPIVVENAIRGESFSNNLLILNPASKIAHYELSATGEIEDWVTFYKQGDLTNPITKIEVPEKTNIEILVKIAIPQTIPNAIYNGKIVLGEIASPNQQSNKNQQSVYLKVDRSVSVTVSDKENISAGLTVISPNNNVVLGDSLQIKIAVRNNGNVSLKPNFELIITKKDGNEVFNAIFPFPKEEVPVMPNEMREYRTPINWSTIGQELGEYAASYRLVGNNNAVYDNGSFAFQINEKESYLPAALSQSINKDLLYIFYFITAGIVLVIILFLIKFFRKQKINQKI